jgi:hypothetical protein
VVRVEMGVLSSVLLQPAARSAARIGKAIDLIMFRIRNAFKVKR